LRGVAHGTVDHQRLHTTRYKKDFSSATHGRHSTALLSLLCMKVMPEALQQYISRQHQRHH
jgi:hypothetical protein